MTIRGGRTRLLPVAILAAWAVLGPSAEAATITITGADVSVGTAYSTGAVTQGSLLVRSDTPIAHGDVDFDISALAPIRDSITSVVLSLSATSHSASTPSPAYWVDLYDKRASQDRVTQASDYSIASDVYTGYFFEMIPLDTPVARDVTGAIRYDLGLDGGTLRSVSGFHLRFWWEGGNQIVNFATSGVNAPALIVTYTAPEPPPAPVPEPASIAVVGLASIAVRSRTRGG